MPGKKIKYVLDSYALLAYFQAEAGGRKVRRILKEASAGRASALLSVINLGEIYYIVARKKGKKNALAIVADVDQLPIDLVEAGTDRVLAAAEVKAAYPLSYADAFVAAAAKEFSATIVTGDPEFKQLESHLSVSWL